MTTRTTEKTANGTKSGGKKPEFTVCYSSGNDKVARQIGAAWLHSEGGGMGIKLNAQCLLRSLSLFPTPGNGFETPLDVNKPSFNVLTRREGEEQLGHIGAAWIHKSGGGINITLNAPCLIGDLVLFPISSRADVEDEDETTADNENFGTPAQEFDDDFPY